MAAVQYVQLADVANNLIYQIEGVVGMELLVVAIGAWVIANPLVAANYLSVDEKNAMLKKLTGCVVATGTDLNCFPTGVDTAICFDLSGDPVP